MPGLLLGVAKARFPNALLLDNEFRPSGPTGLPCAD